MSLELVIVAEEHDVIRLPDPPSSDRSNIRRECCSLSRGFKAQITRSGLHMAPSATEICNDVTRTNNADLMACHRSPSYTKPSLARYFIEIKQCSESVSVSL